MWDSLDTKDSKIIDLCAVGHTIKLKCVNN